MTKITSFPTVKNWVASQFKIQISNAKSLDEKTLSSVGQILLKVHPNSPAGELGLQSGDILYALNGGTFLSDELMKTFQPRRFGRSYSFDFFRPKTLEKIRVKGPTFPFGARFGQTADSFQVELRNGDPDPSDANQYWAMGQMDALSNLLPAFEAYNIRLVRQNGAPFDGPFPQNLPSNTELANDNIIWPGHFTWLALCAAHAGQWDRAAYVLNAVEDHFDRSGDSGMMNMFAAMAYIRSMLAERKGHFESAVNHMHHAIEMSPETEVLYHRLSALTHTDVKRPISPLLNTQPAYKFPKHDPSEHFKQDSGHVSLQESVSRLTPGQFILVTVMSNYRTNGPYVEGFQRAHTPLAALKDIFPEVHIITSWDASRSRDLPYAIMEEKMRKSGIAVSVLFDEDDSFSEELSLTSSPTNFVINHKGEIVSTGWLGGDAVLWDAL